MNVRFWSIAAVLATLGATLAFVGCSNNDNKTTNPPAGGTSFNSGTISASGQYVHTFATAGSFPYHCSFHAPMRDTIVVAPGGADSLTVEIQNTSATGFVLTGGGATGTLAPGGYVHWKSLPGQPAHTVTSDQ